MRTKAEILKESFTQTEKVFRGEITASSHDRLTIEVLIDIRDILNQRLMQIDRGIREQTTVSKEILKDVATRIILPTKEALNNL